MGKSIKILIEASRKGSTSECSNNVLHRKTTTCDIDWEEEKNAIEKLVQAETSA